MGEEANMAAILILEGTVVVIVIETLFPLPLADVAQYHQIPFPVPTG